MNVCGIYGNIVEQELLKGILTLSNMHVPVVVDVVTSESTKNYRRDAEFFTYARVKKAVI